MNHEMTDEDREWLGFPADGRAELQPEIDRLRARVAELEAQIAALDCRLVGRVADLSGSHCPADRPCDRCIAERRIAELEAWQLAIAEGTGFINRAEGQDGYEVADPKTILDYLEQEKREHDDLAALVRQLATLIRRTNPRSTSAERAIDYLKRKGLQGSPLR